MQEDTQNTEKRPQTLEEWKQWRADLIDRFWDETGD